MEGARPGLDCLGASYALDAWEGHPERNVSHGSWLGPGALVSVPTLSGSCREGWVKSWLLGKLP